MLTVEFRGAVELIQQLDEAVRRGDPRRTADAVKEVLCRLLGADELELPECACKPCDEQYARRLLYRSEELDYTVVVMTWGPGQGTPLHDHGGLWCVEGVWSGEIEVEQYEMLGREDGQYRFQYCGTLQAGVGSAGCLIPPHEYHRIRNSRSDRSAVSLHVYAGDMCHCHVFEPCGGDWYRRSEKTLEYSL